MLVLDYVSFTIAQLNCQFAADIGAFTADIQFSNILFYIKPNKMPPALSPASFISQSLNYVGDSMWATYRVDIRIGFPSTFLTIAHVLSFVNTQLVYEPTKNEMLLTGVFHFLGVHILLDFIFPHFPFYMIFSCIYLRYFSFISLFFYSPNKLFIFIHLYFSYCICPVKNRKTNFSTAIFI